jgi:hypothetical protein
MKSPQDLNHPSLISPFRAALVNPGLYLNDAKNLYPKVPHPALSPDSGGEGKGAGKPPSESHKPLSGQSFAVEESIF